MVNEKLLALDGYSRNIDTTSEISLLIKEYEDDLAAEELFKNEILPGVNVTVPEIDSIISYKQTELEIKWLYAADEPGIKTLLAALKEGTPLIHYFCCR